MALRERLEHEGQLEKVEILDLLEGEEKEVQMEKMDLQGVRVKRGRKVNTKKILPQIQLVTFPERDHLNNYTT